jgi:hypothetical protein
MLSGLVLVGLLAASAHGHEEATPVDVDPELVAKSFVVLKSTPSYAEARAFASTAAETLAIRMDLRELSPDHTAGLTFPEDDCRQEFGEFPCYVPRGRYDDGVYISIEHSSSYSGWAEGLYVVVLASGSPRDRSVRAALRRARASYPDAVMKMAPVYLGCIH